ncbi:unnamed protein product [Paramecium octaurelia]|uniref:Uncharacterized protein n=1 Tax=Paramecium octaurelia TaxID=43137 RepID=A0A8S1XAA0_PAROT|nr:unnamed protein product [Paramecium octaurelia]
MLLSGGGSYDENGDGQKIGIWFELNNEFNEQKNIMITY